MKNSCQNPEEIPDWRQSEFTEMSTWWGLYYEFINHFGLFIKSKKPNQKTLKLKQLLYFYWFSILSY